MKKFLKKTFLFLLLLVCSGGLLFCADFFLIGNQNLGSFQASILDKISYAQSITQPKILLAGNSNVSLGFDSARIEAAMGMPVVNMGLHGGLGNAFLENLAKAALNPGDIVVLCHCTYDDDGTVADPALAWITVEMHPELWKLLPISSLPRMAKAYPNYLYCSALRWARGGTDNIPEPGITYSRLGLNERGDVCIRAEDTYVFSADSVSVPGVDRGAVERINELNRYILDRGAILVIAGYPIGSGTFTPESAAFDAFEAELRAALDCPVISHFTDYFLPYDCFYDTVFHLNDKGIALRSNQLIADLRSWLAEGSGH